MQRHTPSTYASVLGPSPAFDTQFYEAYGALRQDYGILTSGHSAPSHKDPVGFGGQWGNYTDTESGLLCLTHRYYDTGTGRFINRDPIDYAGGVNLYGYAGNNPINEMDPSGLSPGGDDAASYLSNIFDHATALDWLNALRNKITRNYNLHLAGHAAKEVYEIYNHTSDYVMGRLQDVATGNVSETVSVGPRLPAPLIFRYGNVRIVHKYGGGLVD